MDESEVVVYQCETAVVRAVRESVAVTVESQQFSFGGETGEYFSGMAAAAERGVDVDSRRVGDEGADALIQKDGDMIL